MMQRDESDQWIAAVTAFKGAQAELSFLCKEIGLGVGLLSVGSDPCEPLSVMDRSMRKLVRAKMMEAAMRLHEAHCVLDELSERIAWDHAVHASSLLDHEVQENSSET